MVVYAFYSNDCYLIFDENHNFLESCDITELRTIEAEYQKQGYSVEKGGKLCR